MDEENEIPSMGSTLWDRNWKRVAHGPDTWEDVEAEAARVRKPSEDAKDRPRVPSRDPRSRIGGTIWDQNWKAVAKGSATW